MSAVTKVLIVVLVVLCVAFSMSAISFVASVNNWQELAEGYRNQAQVADAHERNQMAARAAELAAARDTIRVLNERINQLEVDLLDANTDVARQQAEIARLGSDKRQADALAQRLTNELGIAQAAREQIDKQRKELENRNIELERRNVDLNDRVNELTTRVTVLVQQQRQQAQQISMLRAEKEKLAQGAGFAGAGAGPRIRPAGMAGVRPAGDVDLPTISGHVVEVDGPNVTVSVGSADLVERGMVLVISRGGTLYIGDIEITDVEPNLSAGRLIRSAEGQNPRKGDQVHDEQQFVNP